MWCFFHVIGEGWHRDIRQDPTKYLEKFQTTSYDDDEVAEVIIPPLLGFYHCKRDVFRTTVVR